MNNSPKKNTKAKKVLDSDAELEHLDNALTAAEECLRKLLPSSTPRDINTAFQGHVHRHLAEELSNIADHGHRMDDPEDVPPLPSHDVNTFITTKENAKLFAAAPELLTQLKALMVQIEASHMIVPPNVKAAIAKAEGL